MDTDIEEVATLKMEEQRAYEKFRNKISAAKLALDIQLQQANKRLQRIYSVAGELPVFVRYTPGPEVTIYHSDPCLRPGTGRHRDLGNYSQKRERDARAQYLSRCSACNWSLAERDFVDQLARDAG
jgi:hypothetical protein